MSRTYEYQKYLKPYAKVLRKKMTKEERKLWYLCLSLLPVRAHRQKMIGKYVVDFYIPKNRIVIEADGEQHEQRGGLTADMVRDCYLREHGITVLRYKNEMIRDSFGTVVREILRRLDLDEETTIEQMRAKYRKRKGYEQ